MFILFITKSRKDETTKNAFENYMPFFNFVFS